MLVNEAACDGEAKPSAYAIGALRMPRAVIEVLASFIGEARAVIGDLEDGVVSIVSKRKKNGAATRFEARRVVDDLRDGSENPLAIATKNDRGSTFRERRLLFDLEITRLNRRERTSGLRRDREHLTCIMHALAKVHRAAFDLGQITKVPNDALHLIARSKDRLEDASRSAPDFFCSLALENEIRAHRDGSERSAKVVADGGKEWIL